VSPPLGHASLVEHDDLVGAADGRDTMGHDDRRSALPSRGEPLQNLLLGMGVDGRQRIVENQDLRLDHECPGDGHALLLSPGQRDAAFAHRRVVAFRELGQVLVEARGGRGLREASRMALVTPRAEGNVLRDGRAEEKRLLVDEPDGAAQDRKRNLAYIDAVDEHAAGRGIEQPRQQGEQRGLARSCRADDRRGRPLGHDKRDPAKYLGGAIPDSYVPELDGSPEGSHGLPRACSGLVRDLRLRIQHLEQPLP
jgi:hypothetical protein